MDPGGTQTSVTVKVELEEQYEAMEVVLPHVSVEGLAQVKTEEGGQISLGSALEGTAQVKIEDEDISAQEIEQGVTESAAVKKAKRLAAPKAINRAKHRRMYKPPSNREKYGVDRDSQNLTTYHRSKLRYLLNTLIKQQKWHRAAGVLGVLLAIPFASSKSPALKGCWSDFAAVKEVFQHVDGVKANDLRLRRMFRVLNVNQPNARSRGKVQLELALYLMSVGDREAAYDELRPIVDGKHYSTDPVVNLCHGINSYCLWYQKATEEVSNLAAAVTEIGRPAFQQGLVVPIEGTGENDEPEDDDEEMYREWGKASQGSFGSSFHFRDSQGSRAANQHDKEFGAMDSDVNLWQASQVSIYEETDEQGFVQSGQEFWRDVIVPSSVGLDPRLFPIRVPVEVDQKHYVVPMRDGRTRDLHAAAVKHLKQALASAPDMLPALLPLVQLLLAVHDIKGAVDEIDKCSQALKGHSIPPSIKAVLLESLDKTDPVQLAACYQDVLITNPLSLSSLKGLVNLHASGNLDTELLLECICMHLDVDSGAVDTWEKLASCLVEAGDRLQQASSISVGGDIMEEHIEEGLDGHTGQQLSWDYLQQLWSGRHRWWLNKHFSSKVTASEQRSDADLWLLAYKAACAGHIYGPGESFVEQTCETLEKQQDHGGLNLVKHHCERSLKLFVKQA